MTGDFGAALTARFPTLGTLGDSPAQKRARRIAASPMTKSTMTPEKMAEKSQKNQMLSLMNAKVMENLSPADQEKLSFAKDKQEVLSLYQKAQLIKKDAEKRQKTIDDLKKKGHKFSTGSLVPGTGSGDKVPALLEPGEFVFNRNAVAAIGAGKLSSVNKHYSRFQKGGPVKMASGGAVAGIDMTLMDRAVQNFGTYVDKLGDFADSIKGLEIQLKASHTVEVIINGAQVLAGLQDSIKNLVVAETNKAINSMLDKRFSLPPMD